ncbi:hypothetical protein DPMN_099579 [Dreissena polymorpha]|uniref:Uncharacterized protein n=1 Tax=Dreissena polymorpha TaxID=45954 RepID=A0A9D4R7S6_DREPO|nr:hypothetical protein DPMN_099579 [Dreissena polymorpha]
MATLQRPYHVPTTTTASLQQRRKTPDFGDYFEHVQSGRRGLASLAIFSVLTASSCVLTASLRRRWRPHCALGRRKDAVRTPNYMNTIKPHESHVVQAPLTNCECRTVAFLYGAESKDLPHEVRTDKNAELPVPTQSDSIGENNDSQQNLQNNS